MGLRLFITPPEPNFAANASERGAARSRSTIRRRPTARTTRRRPRLEDRESGMRVSVMPPHAPIRSDTLSPTNDREVDLEDIRLGAISGRARLVGEIPRNSHVSSPGSQTQDGVMVPALVSSNTPRMPPVPETADFRTSSRLLRAIRRRRGEELSSELRRNSRLSASEGGAYSEPPQRESYSDQSASASTQLPSLSHDLALPRQYMSSEAGARSHPVRSSIFPEQPWHLTFISHSRPEVPQPTADGPTSRDLSYLPYLRQMGRRSISDMDGETRRRAARFDGLVDGEARRRAARFDGLADGEARRRAARFDGLGDRDRSLSPDGDGAWETILTTLTPDPQLPSAGSSFVSTSTGAPTSSNAGSSGTSLTTVGSTPDPIDSMDHSTENICDLIDECSELSDTEVDDEDDIYELQGTGLGGNDRFWRSYADVVAARADRVARHSGATDTDNLGGMQRIVARLARREDIPDEWWAGAGLSRIIPRETAN